MSEGLRILSYINARRGVAFSLSFFDNLQGSSNSVAQSFIMTNNVSILTMQTMDYTILDRVCLSILNINEILT